MEILRKFMEALQTDPRAEELLKGKAKPESLEGAVKLYAEAAKELGFDLTEDDIMKGMKSLKEEQAAKTAQAKAAVKELGLEDLEKVAGGAEPGCKDTFEHRENCWLNDACDFFYNDYIHYICAHNDWNGDTNCAGTYY